MRRKVLLGFVVAAMGACASSDRIERGAGRHEARAQQLEEKGDYRAASKERSSAAKQYSKANSRRGFENAMPIAFH